MPFGVWSNNDRPTISPSRRIFPMSPSSTITDDSPIRPLAPPTKKLRSIHNNSNGSHESSTRAGNAPPVRDRFAIETEESIAKRRAELRILQEKRAGRAAAAPRANGVATAAEGLMAKGSSQFSGGSGGPPPTHPPFGGPPRSNHSTIPTTTTQEQPPLVPSPGHVARVRKSDIFPNVSKVLSERTDPPTDFQVPSIPSLAPSSGGPAPRRLDTVFAKDESAPLNLSPQQQYQPPEPVSTPSPDKPPLRSKSAPPSRPPLPPGPPPTRVSEAPEARAGINRSFAARPEPSVVGASEPVRDNKPPSKSQPSSPTSRPTSRQELLRSFHMYDDVNLIQILAQQKKECGEAKRKIARLEDHVLKLTKERIVPRDFETFLLKVKEEGGESALRWARDRFPESFAQISISDWPVALFDNIPATATPMSPRHVLSFSALSPTTSAGTTTSATSTFKRLRAPTPHPKRQSQQQSPHPMNKDSEEYLYLVEAAKCVPIEFFCDVATIFVRCPYGAVNQYNDNDPWNDGTTITTAEANDLNYDSTANVYQPETVQVIAKITADGSLLILSGASTVRYKKNSSETEEAWKTLADDDTISSVASFGTIMYIDGDANEKDFSLDEVFEAAVSTRESYCSSVISTAAGFMAMKILDKDHSIPRAGATTVAGWSSPTHSVAMMDQAVATDVPELVDECVGTEDLPLPTNNKETPPLQVADACVGTEELWQPPKPTVEAKSEKRVATADACVGTEGEFKLEATSATPPLPKEAKTIPTDDKPTHDLLSILIAMFFTSIFGLVWFVLFRLPFQLVKYTTVLLLMWGLLTLAWLYLVDDHGAEAMGAVPLPFYNHYGIV